MPTTPVLSLPYPEGADTADVPRDLQALAFAIEAQSLLPPGALQMWLTDAPPAGWALMNGQTVDAAANPKLAAIFGQTAGLVTLIDMGLKFPMGAKTGLPNAGIRQTGGTNDQILTSAQLPDHQHFEFGFNANYKVNISTTLTAKFADPYQGVGTAISVNEQGPNATGQTGSPVGLMGQAFDNRPRFLAVNFIVRLG